mgnify:FL=1
MKNQILHRLEIIKLAISIEDEEMIQAQLLALKKLELDNKVEHILGLIVSHKFMDVIRLIELYKQEKSGLVAIEDPEIQGLRLELKALEKRVNELSDEKVECERVINNFNSEYMLQLGSVIEEILKLRAELESSATGEGTARWEYESFHKTYQQQLENLPEHLTVDEKMILKSAYRRASCLCHPDKLVGEFKIKGEEIFKELNDAYRRQNLKMVEVILARLESGLEMNIASDSIDDMALLQKRISILRERISTLEDEIYPLRNSEVFKRIQSIENTFKYFSELRESLELELSQLRRQKRVSV